MMKRTGLFEVFVSALKNNFIYLPPLTSEGESLDLLKSLYPAFFALVDTRFPHTPHSIVEEDHLLHAKTLTLLLRHSLLCTLTTLTSPDQTTSTTSPGLTTYLLSQLPPLLQHLGPRNTTKHIPHILPLLRCIISDPFATASPALLIMAIDAMYAVLGSSRKGVVDRWWVECLRGCVGCWLNIEDEGERKGFEEVRGKLRGVVRVLKGRVARGEFEMEMERLVGEEGGLRGLFEGGEGSGRVEGDRGEEEAES